MIWHKVLITAFASLFALTGANAQDGDFIVNKELAYGDQDRQKLDIYSPELIEPDTPVIVFFHGRGSLRSKDHFDAHGKSFAEAGIIFVAANYRLYPEAVFPDFASDVAAATAFALNYLRTGRDEYRPLFVAGWSAGGYNAALVAFDERLLSEKGYPKGTVTGVIGLSAPYEGGMCMGQRCGHLFPEELRADWNVARHVDAGDPPMILIAAQGDVYAPLHQAHDLVEAAHQYGIEANILVLPKKSHSATLRAILKPDSDVRAMVDAFIFGTASDQTGAE